MLRIYNGLFIIVSRDLSALCGQLYAFGEPDDKPLVSHWQEQAVAAVKQLESLVSEIPVSYLLQTKVARLVKTFEKDDHLLTYRSAADLLKQIQEDLIVEMVQPVFLMIPTNRREFFLVPAALFGSEVGEAFPDAIDDIDAAGRCIALDEWTAAVFHLMRVAEHGLRSLARELAISLSTNVEYENWKNVIEQIHGKIRALDQVLLKGAEKSEKLRVYSQAAINLEHFKNAWRNHVSHARGKYDERDAMNVWLHVRQFMHELAVAGLA